jgi:nucleoside phosphorylase
MSIEAPLAWDTTGSPSAFDPEDWLAHRERQSGRRRPRLPRLAVQTVDETVWAAARRLTPDEPDDFTAAGHPFLVIDRHVVAYSAKGSTAIGGLDELFALGARACVSIGGAGAITTEVPVGSVLVPAQALADDGVACHYVGPARYVSGDVALTAALCAAAVESVACVPVARVWTTTAHFRQTVSRLEAFRQEGCVAVDNESAGTFAVAAYRGAAAARVLVVGDTIAGGRFHVPDETAAPPAERLLELALEALDRWDREHGP